jgi:hypothetical protein
MWMQSSLIEETCIFKVRLTRNLSKLNYTSFEHPFVLTGIKRSEKS